MTKRQRGPEPQSRYAAENVNNSSCEKTKKGFWTVINPFMGLHHVPLVSLEFAVIVQIGNTLKLHILVIGPGNNQVKNWLKKVRREEL